MKKRLLAFLQFNLLLIIGVALLLLPAGVSRRVGEINHEILQSLQYAYWWRRYRWWPRRFYNSKNPVYWIHWRYCMKGRY